MTRFWVYIMIVTKTCCTHTIERHNVADNFCHTGQVLRLEQTVDIWLPQHPFLSWADESVGPRAA